MDEQVGEQLLQAGMVQCGDDLSIDFHQELAEKVNFHTTTK